MGEKTLWNKLNCNDIVIIENMVNAYYQQHPEQYNNIRDIFEKLNLPLGFNAPGYWDTFFADVTFRWEEIEDWCLDHD